MTKSELLEKLRTYNMPAIFFSLNEALKPHAYILFESDGVWAGFYFDEKGMSMTGLFIPLRRLLTITWNAEILYQALWQASIPTGVMCCYR